MLRGGLPGEGVRELGEGQRRGGRCGVGIARVTESVRSQIPKLFHVDSDNVTLDHAAHVELDNLCRRTEPVSECGGHLRGARRAVYRLNVEDDSCVGVYNDQLVLQKHDGVSVLVGGDVEDGVSGGRIPGARLRSTGASEKITDRRSTEPSNRRVNGNVVHLALQIPRMEPQSNTAPGLRLGRVAPIQRIPLSALLNPRHLNIATLLSPSQDILRA